MLLSAAFLPPASVLEDVRAMLDSPVTRTCHLELLRLPDLQMSVSVFGNVARAQMGPIAQVLSRASERWPAPATLRFSGGAALEWPGDTSVWVKATVDAESLEAIARSIAPAVNRLGFALDRRRFHPLLPVARVTATTELKPLESLLARLDAYTGPAWTADRLSLMRVTFDATGKNGRGFEVVAEIPLPASGAVLPEERTTHWAIQTASRT